MLVNNYIFCVYQSSVHRRHDLIYLQRFVDLDDSKVRADHREYKENDPKQSESKKMRQAECYIEVLTSQRPSFRRHQCDQNHLLMSP
jgi:hypothetical protein